MDIAASLRCLAVEVECAGEWFTVPALPASEWLEVLTTVGWSGIFPGLLERADRQVVGRAIIHRETDAEEILECAHAVLEVAGGRRWWWTLNLVGSVTNAKTWAAVHGQLLRSGVRADELSLGGWLDACYAMLVENLTEEKRSQLDRALEQAPVGTPIAEQYDEAEAADDFLSALGDFEGDR